MTDLYRERVRVTKMHGTGNDFLLIDLRSPSQEKLLQSNFGPLNRAGIAKRLCQRRLSIGADGLAFLLQK